MSTYAQRTQAYRQVLREYTAWLSEFPDIYHVLETLRVTSEQTESLNAGTPNGMEFCTISGLRQQIREMRDAATAHLPKPQPVAQGKVVNASDVQKVIDRWDNGQYGPGEVVQALRNLTAIIG